MRPRIIDREPLAQPFWTQSRHPRPLAVAPGAAPVRGNMLGRGFRSGENLVRRFRDDGLRAPALATSHRIETLNDGSQVVHHVHHHPPRGERRPNATMLGVGRHPNFHKETLTHEANRLAAHLNGLWNPHTRHHYDHPRGRHPLDNVDFLPRFLNNENDVHHNIRNHHSHRHRHPPRRTNFATDLDDILFSDDESLFGLDDTFGDALDLDDDHDSILGGGWGLSPRRGRQRFWDHRSESVLRDESSQFKKSRLLN